MFPISAHSCTWRHGQERGKGTEPLRAIDRGRHGTLTLRRKHYPSSEKKMRKNAQVFQTFRKLSGIPISATYSKGSKCVYTGMCICVHVRKKPNYKAE